MYEITQASPQTKNTKKYRIGIPKMAPSLLKIQIRGILKRKKSTSEITTNFCSCLFFMRNRFPLKVVKQCHLCGTVIQIEELNN